MTKYTVCDWCEQEMAPGNGCDDAQFKSADDIRQRLRFTVERIDQHGHDNMASTPDDICHDCNVKVGQFHHFGCDWERCPFCRGQLISCNCRFVLDFPASVEL